MPSIGGESTKKEPLLPLGPCRAVKKGEFKGLPVYDIMQGDVILLREIIGSEWAALFAAAPELLEALKLLLIAHDCGADETGYVTDVGFLDIDAFTAKARAAITKAEGGQG